MNKLILTVSLLIVAAVVGCASAPTTAYKTEATTDAAVRAALTGWDAYVKQYHPPASQELAVSKAFGILQQAELAQIDATRAYVLAQGTNGVPVNSNGVTTAATASAQALTDLLNLITQLETSTK